MLPIFPVKDEECIGATVEFAMVSWACMISPLENGAKRLHYLNAQSQAHQGHGHSNFPALYLPRRAGKPVEAMELDD
jgi:hypothetical protein